MHKLKFSFLSLLALALLASPLASRADSIQLVSATGSTVNGVVTYPYNISINGSSATTAVSCLNFDREITIGETWNVTIHGLDTTGTSSSAVQYREDAWLFSLYNTKSTTYNNSDIQFAIWSIFDSAVTSNSGYTSASASLVSQAYNQATSSSLINSGFFNQFRLFTPTNDQTGWTKGTPQELMGYTDPAATAATPEPSSLMLLGTGLLSTGAAIMRRRRSMVTA